MQENRSSSVNIVVYILLNSLKNHRRQTCLICQSRCSDNLRKLYITRKEV